MRTWIAVLALLATSCAAAEVVAGYSAAPMPDGLFGPPSFTVLIVAGDGEPIDGAALIVRGEELTPDDAVVWHGDPVGFTASAPGFRSSDVYVETRPTRRIEVQLDPIILEGLVVGMGDRPLVGARVTLGDTTVTTGPEGRFSIERAIAAPVFVQRAGYEIGEFAFEEGPLVMRMEPAQGRGIHVGGPQAGDPERWQELLALADSTEINLFVVDVKDESGLVFYDTSVELAHEVGAVNVKYDPATVVADMRARDLYIVGRIVSFQDPLASRAAPEISVWDSETNAPYRSGNQYFLDPTDSGARGYALDLAVDACKRGFDEIQFDYVRYPDGFGEFAVFDGGAGPDVRSEAIRTFLQEAARLLHPMGCAVAADIFGFITTVPGDGGIGQQLEALAGTVDVLSPMLYPSHYSRGWFGYDSPVANPGGVVAEALDDGLERVSGDVIIRPWIQDFSYSDAQVRAQIDAAHERGVGWMLWNAVSEFSEGALADDG